MNEFHIHNAIGELSEELIAPVEKLRMKKRRPVVQWVAAAACLLLLLGLPLSQGDRFAVKVENTNDGMQVEAPQENYLTDSDCSTHVFRFRASVLEVHDGYILVEPLEEREQHSSDRYEISFAKIKQIPQIKAGDIVEITYDGSVQEVYPCRITEVFSIKVVE